MAMTNGNEPQAGIVREFGKAFRADYDMRLNSPIVIEKIENDINEVKKLFEYLKDVKYVEEFHPVEGPATEYLPRHRAFGWYGKAISPGYDAFEEYFKCHKEHAPAHPSLEYIQKMMVLYLADNLKEFPDGLGKN